MRDPFSNGGVLSLVAYILLAGKFRELPPDAKIGLRLRLYSADALRDSFEKHSGSYGWKDAFGQGAMVYDCAQADMRWMLVCLTRRGVSMNFALKIFAISRGDMWWPDHDELLQAGVLTTN